MTALIVQADAGRLPLPDDSIDLIVTSPPFFALRSYTDGGEHYAGQLGDEPTVSEYLDRLVEFTAEWRRVLKPTGSIMVNLGDKYGRKQNTNVPQTKHGSSRGLAYPSQVRPSDRPKSLLGVPWRYAIRCTDELGLTLRSEIVWSKPNGLPESVTDRVRRSHETWFHFVLDPYRYFSALDEIREPYATRLHAPGNRPGLEESQRALSQTQRGRHQFEAGEVGRTWGNRLGRLPGSVWQVNSEPLVVPDELGVDHFAAFPVEWPRRLILGFSPAAICVECGEGRRPVTVAADFDAPVALTARQREERGWNAEGDGPAKSSLGVRAADRERRIVGYVCGCPDLFAATRRAVVLDPFGGSGTTALAASVLGRVGVSGDLSHDYGRLARWRTADDGERARAARIPKPPVQIDGQETLFA